MRLTQLFVRRPTLAVVVLAVIALVGSVAYATLVKQQFPNVDFPTVSVRLSYPGGSPSEIRDAIVKPIEDAIAGAPNLDFLTSSIQQGQATIQARFLLSSDKTTDLVEVERRVQSVRGVLPTDLTPPFIGTFDPSEANVVTLAASSRSLSRATLSAIVTNSIVPELEQIDGVANVNASGTVTPAIEVAVDPHKLGSAALTPADVVSAISSNNVRAPGGFVYSQNRETAIDVRGDVSDVSSVEHLLLVSGVTGNVGATTGPSGAAVPQFGSRSGPAAGATIVTANVASGAGAAAPTSVTALGSQPATAGSNAAPASNAAAGPSQTPIPISTPFGGSIVAATASPSAGTANVSTSPATPAPLATFASAARGAVAGPSQTSAPQSVTGTTAIVFATPPASSESSASGGTPLANAANGPGPPPVPSTGGASSSGTAGSSGGTSSGGTVGSNSALNQWSVAPRLLRVADVATVYDDYEPQRTYSYVGGQLAISLNVQKQTGASEVAVSENVKRALPRLRAEYPAIDFAVLNVQADFSQQQIDAVLRTLVGGIVVTGIVMLLFLGSWRNAIVVLIAIPCSFGITLGLMRLFGFTIDTVSLLAMTLIIGILVDDSIVVLENITRHFADGEAPQTAAILGRSEIGNAAIVITLVDVVVFLPIAFLPGIVGRFLSEFGLVVVAATLTSLAISFTVTPALAGNWSLLSQWRPPALLRAFARGFEAVRRFYVRRVLVWALRHPLAVAGVSLALTVGAIALVPAGVVGFEFIPRVDRGEIFQQVDFPVGTPLAVTNAAIARLSAEIAQMNEVERVTSVAGQYQASFGGSTALGSSGQIHVFLKQQTARNTDRVAQSLGRHARNLYPTATITAIPATGTGGGNAQPIDYIITAVGDKPEPVARQVYEAMVATPGATNVNSSVMALTPQVDVTFDREAARALNVQISSAASAVRTAFGGALATQFSTSFGTKYVQVIYPQRAQSSIAAIKEIPVRTQGAAIVHVGDVAKIVFNPQPPLISRTNRQTVIHVSANNAQGTPLSSVQNRFRAKLAALHLPDGVVVRPQAGGNQQNLADTTSGVGAALGLSFLLVYLLMVALYDSYRLPFIIMFAIPVASVGAFGALALTHQTLNLFSMIGVVMLVGLVSKNGILLVELASEKARAGVDRVTAISEAAHERFRPIVMTTASMIAGMLPIALALDPGAGSRRALGVVVIGGLSSSLLLTLLLVPVAFVRFAPRFAGPAKGSTDAPATAEGAAVPAGA
jgi:hydrophobic/amphiphilic exporter-1 (mainly G- bacteria), HAE1 family